jgi:hypothetical protein
LDSYAIPPTTYQYRDAPRRSAWLPRLLAVDMAGSAVYLAASVAGLFVPAVAKAVTMAFPAIAVLIAGSAALFLFWIYRAAANAHALGADITFEAPGAVGWLIAPVLSIWMGFVVVEEIWRASLDADNWRDQHAPWLVIQWWAAWVVASLGFILLLFGGGIVAKVVYFAGHIAYCYLLIQVTYRIRELQQTQAAMHGLA